MAFFPVVAGLMMLSVLVACEHTPLDHSGTVRSFQILDTMQPTVLYAQVRDEIRWENLSNKVVHLRFLAEQDQPDVDRASGVARKSKG